MVAIWTDASTSTASTSSGTYYSTTNVSTSGTLAVTSPSTTTGTVFNTTGGGAITFVNGNNQLTVAQGPPVLQLLSKTRIKIGPDLFDTLGDVLEVSKGQKLTIQLPDESAIFIEADGSYNIRFRDGKPVRRQACRDLEFNRYINSSDLLEEFIKDLGVVGVKQDEVLNVPIELFINWLIIRAAEQDGEEPPEEVPRLETEVKKTCHCKWCGRFISKQKDKVGISFCNADHYKKYENKIEKLQ